MEQLTPYQYKANNAGSYNALAAYAILTLANVSFYPEQQTIVVSPTEKSHKVINDIGVFIDREGLDFYINPICWTAEDAIDALSDETVDTGTLRLIINQLLEEQSKAAKKNNDIIAEISAKHDLAVKNCEEYKRWWHDSNKRLGRVKDQVQSIGVLINSIFPVIPTIPGSKR